MRFVLLQMLSICMSLVAVVPAVAQNDQSAQTIADGTADTAQPNSKSAPVWQRIGNTGMPAGNWAIQFDPSGVMYISSNNVATGGVSKSTNKGYTWKVINTGFTCTLHPGMGVAPNGTVFAGNDYCTVIHQGNNHFYWLDNIGGTGTVWKSVTTPNSVGNGSSWGQSVIANDGKTIVSTALSGIWLSTDNARTWVHSPGSPVQGTNGVAEGLDTHKQPDGTIYAGFAHGGVFYSKDNGQHFTQLGYPPVNPGNTNHNGGDIWAMATAPAGPVGGYLMVGAGDSGNNGAGAGLWCYGPQAPPNGKWVFCGNNDPLGKWIDFTRIITNPSKTRTIAIHNGTRGAGVLYTDDGINWYPANSGLPPDPSTTYGGAATGGLAVDNSTSYYYIVLRDGDVYRTTVPQ
ncbi:MAG TPA: hypothetical protein VE779_07770 [Candidatus Angelobacter sp.]|nr:hypothetical protein [Candidatus Angelobacter sp.]